MLLRDFRISMGSTHFQHICKAFVFLIKPHFPARAPPKLLRIKCCLPSSICPLLPGAFPQSPSPSSGVGCQPRFLTCRAGGRRNLLPWHGVQPQPALQKEHEDPSLGRGASRSDCYWSPDANFRLVLLREQVLEEALPKCAGRDRKAPRHFSLCFGVLLILLG